MFLGGVSGWLFVAVSEWMCLFVMFAELRTTYYLFMRKRSGGQTFLFVRVCVVGCVHHVLRALCSPQGNLRGADMPPVFVWVYLEAGFLIAPGRKGLCPYSMPREGSLGLDVGRATPPSSFSRVVVFQAHWTAGTGS